MTEFEFRLHPVGQAALARRPVLPPEDAPRSLRRWRDLLQDAPRHATLTAWVGTSGQWPFLPPALRSRPLASVGYVWVGQPDQGRRLLPALRDAAPPLAQRVQELSYLELQRIDDHRQRHGLRRYWKGHFLRELADQAIEAFLSRGAGQGDGRGDGDPADLPSGSLQGYGGAIAAVGDGQAAFAHRDALVEFVAAASWTDAAEDQARIAAARRYGAAVAPFASGVYVNALTDEGAGVCDGPTARTSWHGWSR